MSKTCANLSGPAACSDRADIDPAPGASCFAGARNRAPARTGYVGDREFVVRRRRVADNNNDRFRTGPRCNYQRWKNLTNIVAALRTTSCDSGLLTKWAPLALLIHCRCAWVAPAINALVFYATSFTAKKPSLVVAVSLPAYYET